MPSELKQPSPPKFLEPGKLAKLVKQREYMREYRQRKRNLAI
jgi:hypothetical protein